jgi:ABC-type transport system involved in multi-copper enzyme maturation permease subunit
MMKTWWIAERLLWQNRWLFLLLFLWPYAMAAVLLLPHDRPDAADVVSMLHQECLYGLALVAVNGSAQLGNEQRSRRIIGVLSRAVSRPRYLLALLLASWLPLALYVVGFVISGWVLAASVHNSPQGLWQMAAIQLLVGLWLGAVSLFFSILLQYVLASIATMLTAAAAVWTALVWSWPGVGRLLIVLPQIGLTRGLADARELLNVALTLVFALVVFAASCWIFERRDLNLTAD